MHAGTVTYTNFTLHNIMLISTVILDYNTDQNKSYILPVGICSPIYAH